MKFRYGRWRAGLLVAALALVLGAGRPLQAGGAVPPAPACPEAGPSPSLACDKEILLAVRGTLSNTTARVLKSWQPDAPLADFTGVTVGGTRPGS